MSDGPAKREAQARADLVRALSEQGLLLTGTPPATSVQLALGAAPQACAQARALGLDVTSTSRVTARVGTHAPLELSARVWRASDVAVCVAELAVDLDARLACGDRVLGLDAPAGSWPEFAVLASDPARPLGVPFVRVFDVFGSLSLARFEGGEFGVAPVPSSPVVETFAGLLASTLLEEYGDAPVWVSRQAAPLLGALSRLAFEHAALLLTARALEGVEPPVRTPRVRPVLPDSPRAWRGPA